MSCFRMQRAFVFGLAFFVWATLPIFHVGIDVRAQQSNAAALAPDEVTTKAQILKKPEAQYTEAARQNDVNGAVLLRVVLAADGTVKHILALQSLSNGLTEQTIKAARQIKFIPATKDNHPVSTSVMIEYEFHLY